MEKNISISVVITTFNRPICFLEQALESVLLQTLKPLEIIVIDDNSNELFSNSVQFYCQSKKVIYVHNSEKHGACAARNAGIKKAKGNYIAFLDDDDIWLPNKLEEQIKVISAETVLVYCNGWRVDKNFCPEKTVEYRDSSCFQNKMSFEKLLEKNYIGTTTQLLVKKSSLDRIYGFDEELPARQDYDLCLRLSMQGELVGVNQHLFVHYIHSEKQISKSSAASLIAYKKLLKKYKVYYNSQKKAKSNLFFKIARMERLQNHHLLSVLYLIKGVICTPFNLMVGIKELKKNTTV